VGPDDGPTAASHSFYRRLNQLLREHGFDDFVEGQCAGESLTLPPALKDPVLRRRKWADARAAPEKHDTG
jgi:hypothetical protein